MRGRHGALAVAARDRDAVFQMPPGGRFRQEADVVVRGKQAPGKIDLVPPGFRQHPTVGRDEPRPVVPEVVPKRIHHFAEDVVLVEGEDDVGDGAVPARKRVLVARDQLELALQGVVEKAPVARRGLQVCGPGGDVAKQQHGEGGQGEQAAGRHEDEAGEARRLPAVCRARHGNGAPSLSPPRTRSCLIGAKYRYMQPLILRGRFCEGGGAWRLCGRERAQRKGRIFPSVRPAAARAAP